MKWSIIEYKKWIKNGAVLNNTVMILNITSSNITSLIEVNNLPRLKILHCSDNRIVDIECLNLPLLEELYCGNNRITDIECLSLPSLQILICADNRIVNIQKINTPLLKELQCFNNQIIKIQDLDLPLLKKINCTSNYIKVCSLRYTRNLLCIYYNNNPIEYIAPNLRNAIRKSIQNVYSDKQNVHNHHIQESITKSIHNIISIKPSINNLHSYIINDTILSKSCKQLLFEYIDDKTIHSTLNITFEDLLLCTLSLIEINKHSTDIKSILNDEINDSLCKCYTGRMSRLINCLNGYTDKVEITISDSEQIGYIIQSVKNELEINNDYTAEKHKELVKNELLERQYETNVINEWISYIE
jgi:hypothetical protein